MELLFYQQGSLGNPPAPNRYKGIPSNPSACRAAASTASPPCQAAASGAWQVPLCDPDFFPTGPAPFLNFRKGLVFPMFFHKVIRELRLIDDPSGIIRSRFLYSLFLAVKVSGIERLVGRTGFLWWVLLPQGTTGVLIREFYPSLSVCQFPAWAVFLAEKVGIDIRIGSENTSPCGGLSCHRSGLPCGEVNLGRGVFFSIHDVIPI